MQTCSICKEEKPLEDFYSDKRGKNGKRTDCKACSKATGKKRYLTNRSSLLAKQAAYYLEHAEEAKQYAKEWRAANPDKTRKYHQEYAEANKEAEKIRHREKSQKERDFFPEKVKERDARWRAANPDKVAQKNHLRRIQTKGSSAFRVLDSELKRILGTPCAMCGSLDKLSLDHIIPLARGGRHSVGNLQSLCKPCNSSKGTKTMTEWLKSKNLLGVK